MKNTVNFAHLSFSFILLYFFVLTFVIKLKSANYKSHWNILVIYNQWKIMSDLKNVWICFISIVWFQFSHKTQKFRFWRSLKYFNIFDKKRYGVRFEYVPWKNVGECFISIAWVHFSYKTEKCWFWRPLHNLIFFDKNRYGARIEYVPWKNISVFFISIIWVHFTHKTEKFRFLR